MVIVLFGQLGCKKFLDRRPLGQAIDGDITQTGAEDKVFGLYAATRNWGMTSLPFLTIHGARADDNLNSTEGDGTDAQAFVDHFGTTNKDFWLNNAVWDDHLAFVQQASGILKDIDSTGVSDSGTVINKAEVSFLRAYAYFDLVRDYGDVPKIDFKVYKASDANVPRSPASEIYALIDADLQFASQNLPVAWAPQYAGRVTKGTADALQAKTYLYRKSWGAALSSAEMVITSGRYSLVPNFADVFTEPFENSSESIFEIQNYENANGSSNISNNVAQYQGVRGSGQWDLGWGWNIPDSNLVEKGFEAGDPRKGQTILFSGAKDDSLIKDGKFGQTLPNLKTKYWNKKAYTDPGRRASTGDRFGNWLDMLIIRYSDVLLMAAEAANEQGMTEKALGYLEQVRARARNNNPDVLPAVTSTDQAVIRAAIKQERRAEFAMEFERFYDLVRWGDADSVLKSRGYTSTNALLPIPQPAIDKSNGKLTQNPGY